MLTIFCTASHSLAQARGMGLDDKTAKDLEDFATLRGGRRQAVVVGQRWQVASTIPGR